MTKRTFSVWLDVRTRDFEVVVWEEGVPTIVQTGLRTRAKAEQARQQWLARSERLEDAHGR